MKIDNLLPMVGGEDKELMYFDCPGCNTSHFLRFTGDHPVWTWNGNNDAPTITPSYVIKWDIPGGQGLCHSIITDGNIQFLSDCTHSLAGQTVELPDID